MFSSSVDFSNGFHVALVVIGIFAIALGYMATLLHRVAQQLKAQKPISEPRPIEPAFVPMPGFASPPVEGKNAHWVKLIRLIESEMTLSAQSLSANNRFDVLQDVSVNYQKAALEMTRIALKEEMITENQALSADDNQRRYLALVVMAYFLKALGDSRHSITVHSGSVQRNKVKKLSHMLVLQRIAYLAAFRVRSSIVFEGIDQSTMNLDTIDVNFTLFRVNVKGKSY